MEIKTNEGNIININDQDIIESKNRNLIDKVIKKWLSLQKIIKEEMTLDEIIIKHQENEFIRLKEYYKKFYTLKLKNRKIFEEVNFNQKKQEYILSDKYKEIDNINSYIEDLLFLFRNNYDYIITLIGLITDDDDEKKILSLAELFSVQFYENILISNPEKEELLLLIYKLLKKEIEEMCCTSIDEFLIEDTFLGKFISSFDQKYELTGFLSSIINPMITEIENNCPGNKLNMSLYDINDFYENKASYGLGVNDTKIKNILLSNIPKIQINFHENKNEEEESDDESSEDDKNEYLNMDNFNTIEDSEAKNVQNTEDKNKSNNNDVYIRDLDLNYLEEKMSKEENNNMKNLYLYQIEQIIDNENIYTNQDLIRALKSNKFKMNLQLITEKYTNNFIFIKSKIDWLIQSLYNKIDSIPYSVRCICKLIFIIIKDKFPNLNKYLQNSFIGKFIFNNCIFPILIQENTTLINPQILSMDTKKVLNIIKNVLDHANRCLLFKSNIELEYTIFNHYLLDLIPLLNIFYDKLTDIEFPPILNNIINKNYRKSSSKFLIDEIKENLKYDYFQENKDELFNLQCICFSLDDILFILTLINRDIKAFNSLENFENFEINFKQIKKYENKLKGLIHKDDTSTEFFLSFKEEKNPQFENLKTLNKNKMNISYNNNFVSEKFKLCIKTILRGLNLLNNKDYSHLNKSFSNKEFFTSLKYTLDDFGELIEEKKQKNINKSEKGENIEKNIKEIKNDNLPLKWYGEYIYTNKKLLEEKYMENDYELLYNELFKEESNNLEQLKSISSLLIAKDGMNLRCAENILQKATHENFIIDKNKDFIGIDKFIEEENIEVCFQIDENKINNTNEGETVDKLKKRITKKKIINSVISIIDAEKCPHNTPDIKSSKNEIKEKNKSLPNPYHAYSIRDFINKFSDHPWNITEKIKLPINYIKEEINKADRNYKIYSTFSQYKSIIKKHLKNPKNTKINLLATKSESIYIEIANKIEDYIMREIYVYVFPKEQSKKDLEFYNQTKKLSWITPEHLDINKLYINQLNPAILWIKKIDEKKSIRDKLFCISSAYNIMNNIIKFSSGKNDDAGQDELTPIFQYIIIKAQPPRIYSNINYVKCFLDEEDLTGELGFLFSQMESATFFVMDINYQSLRISEEEFNRNIKACE